MKNLDRFLDAGADGVKLAELLNKFGACPLTLYSVEGETIEGETMRSCALSETFGCTFDKAAEEKITKICTCCLAEYLNEEVSE